MSKFLANVLKLSSATVLGQLLGLIVLPLLSRLYSPADFGIYQLFFSIASVIIIVSCLAYESAIILPKKDEDAANIVILCLLLIIITSIFTTVLFFVFSGYIDHLLNTPGLSNYFFLLPFAIICNSFAFVLHYWLLRREEFGIIAKGNIYSSISGKAVSVGAGMISPSPFGLIFGTIINDATIIIVFLKRIIADFHFIKDVSYDRIKQLANRYKKFPQYDLGAKLIGGAAGLCVPFLITVFFSPIIVGYYAMSLMVINMPLKLVGNSLSSVFYQKIGVEKNLTGSVKNIVKTVHTRLISLGMFGCLIVMMIGPELFTFVLGNQWYMAGVYAQILSPYFFVLFISGPLLSILNVMEKQNVSLWFNSYILISTIIVLIIGGLYADPITVMILLSCNGVVSWSWMNMYTLKIAGVSRRDEMHEIIRYLLFGLFICMPLLIAKYYAIPSNILILIAIVVSIIYYLIIVYQDTELKKGLVNFVGNIRQK